jgi:putative copper export protein
VAFPFFVLYVLAVWALADGARWAPVVVTAVGTFLVQTHVGYLPLVAVGAAAAVAMLVLDARRRGESLRPWRRPLGWSLAVGALLWLAPVFEQLTTPTGT